MMDLKSVTDTLDKEFAEIQDLMVELNKENEILQEGFNHARAEMEELYLE
jgi:hypothetical protein